jgi:hypothetical protein
VIAEKTRVNRVSLFSRGVVEIRDVKNRRKGESHDVSKRRSKTPEFINGLY